MATVSAASSLAPFLSKTYDMVDDPQTDDVVSWSDTNDAIVVWDVRDFTRQLLPKFFKHNNFSSFVRQLNTYGFRKVHPDRWEFANDGFRKGHKHLLKNISRRKPSHSQGQEQPSQTGGSPVTAKNDGIEEEVEKLKTDKNVLVQELVRLRQQQQLTDHQFQNVGQRVHVMEQHQQQMMSFLAKAMQNPGFIAQLFHQPSESKSPKSGGNNKNKKRRFPNPEEENLTRKLGIGDGQIVEYQPLMNEAAMAMLQQILKMSASGRIETKINNINGFLMDNMDPPSNVLDKGSSPSQISGVTLPMALPTIQCSPRSANGQARGTQCPETDVPLLGSPQAGGVNAVKVDLPDDPFKPTESGHMMHMDAIPGSVDGPTPDLDVDVMVDEFPKLPGINDVFWEQFLSSSPVSGETNEIDYSMLGGGLGKELDQETEEEDESDKMQNISSLTKEMGLLASASHSG